MIALNLKCLYEILRMDKISRLYSLFVIVLTSDWNLHCFVLVLAYIHLVAVGI